MATKNNQKLAVLIDADNAQASVIQALPAEVSRYGTATIKRAFGDWTTTNLNALNATAREDGWATLAALGGQINRSHPSFDPRNYGGFSAGAMAWIALVGERDVSEFALTHLHAAASGWRGIA